VAPRAAGSSLLAADLRSRSSKAYHDPTRRRRSAGFKSFRKE
jgi:hypothetical protein